MKAIFVIVCLLISPLMVVCSSSGRGHLAFISDRDGNQEIYVMDADGRRVVRLTDHPASDSSPSWSPDGKRIAFASDRDGNEDIYVMKADGSRARRLTEHPADDNHPAWARR